MINFKEFMKVLNITQSRNGGYSHQGANAYDLAGADSGKDMLYVPKGQEIKCIGFEVGSEGAYYSFFEFQKPIKLKNGSKVNKLQFFCLHGYGKDKTGTLYKEGQSFYDEGSMGHATGNHVHIEFGTGYSKSPFYLKQNSKKIWIANFKTTYNIEDIFYVTPDTKVINKQGLNFSNKDNNIVNKWNVWTFTDENGQINYVYSEKYENGRLIRNQLDKQKILTRGLKGYTELIVKATTNLYKDKRLTKVHQKSNKNDQLKAGDKIMARYVGKEQR